MDAVSVESINLLLSFSDKLRRLQDQFRYGVDKILSDTNIIINDARMKYHDFCHVVDEAQVGVDNCKEEVERVKDEMDYLRNYREDYDPDDYHYQMDSLRDELNDAKSALSDARDALSEARDKRDESQRLYNDIRFWCERLRLINDSTIDSDFDNCRKFIEKYGNYLVDAMKGM